MNGETSSQQGSGPRNPPAAARSDRGESQGEAARESVRPRCVIDGCARRRSCSPANVDPAHLCAWRELVGAFHFDTYKCETCKRVDMI